MNWFVRFAARALDVREREAVLGDLVESGETGWGALCDVLGLAIRRQLEIWTDWRPWVALIGVAGLSGCCLSMILLGINGAIVQQLNAWLRYGVHYNTGVTSFSNQMILISVDVLAIACWSAAGGFALHRLSGRAAWLTALFFYLTVFDSAPAYRLLSGNIGHTGHWPWWFLLGWLLPLDPLRLCEFVLLFGIPAVIGARRRLPGLAPVTVFSTIAAAVLGGIRAHDLEKFSGGQFPAPSWWAVLMPYVMVSWSALVEFPLRSRTPR